jgi:uncharacterized protein
VIEEAHRLLRAAPPGEGQGTAAHAVETFAGLLAEIRAYGEGLVIAEQIPAKLIPDVIKNTAVKIVHRLPAADDREAVGTTMNITGDQSRYLVTLTPGEAAVFTDGMDYPLLARMPDGTARETRHPAPAAPPADVITPRSATCGPDCRQSPCTLRDMREAQQARTAHPAITVWAEYAVLAHLTGQPAPVPAPRLRDLMTALPSRVRDCAISHAADAAVASRAASITVRVSPAALAAHVTAWMRAALSQHPVTCHPPEDAPAWLAPSFRWALVLAELDRLHARDPAAGPHPRTPHWERAYGQPVPGATCAAQRATVSRWYDADTRDEARLRAAILGTRTPSAIEQAAGARAGDSDWDEQLAETLEWFEHLRFPLAYLAATPPARDTSPPDGG